MPSSIYLVGPTASGKSAVALALAEKLGGEIISVDSMQVYRGLDLGTAKPRAAERARVPHHLIDVVNLTEPFDAAKFVDLAARAEADIRARGGVPIYCGGTGLYLKAHLEGLGEAPPSDAKLRAELEAAPLDELLRELAQRDPATYERIDRQNPRRVVRALEVIRLTGRPFSQQRAAWQPPGSSRGHETPLDKAESRKRKAEANLSHLQSPILNPQSSVDQSLVTSTATGAHIIGLHRTAPDLHARIHARVDEMCARGLVEETRALLRQGLEQNPTALQAIGYRQVVEHLRGERPLAETIELVKSKTRQFAKRQMTWFRRQLPVEWIAVNPSDSGDLLSDQIARKLS